MGKYLPIGCIRWKNNPPMFCMIWEGNPALIFMISGVNPLVGKKNYWYFSVLHEFKCFKVEKSKLIPDYSGEEFSRVHVDCSKGDGHSNLGNAGHNYSPSKVAFVLPGIIHCEEYSPHRGKRSYHQAPNKWLFTTKSKQRESVKVKGNKVK